MVRKFAAFDIDGTLIRWQLFHSIVKKLVEHNALSNQEYARMEELFDKWKTRTALDAFHQYEHAMLATWQVILQHVSYSDYMQAVEAAFQEHKNYVYRYTRDLIMQLKDEGYLMIAISGSQQEVVDKIADYYGFDIALGSKWPTKGEAFTGERFSPVDDKGAALTTIAHAHGLTFTDSWAVGDSGSDSKMLALVENPVAFNPDRALLTAATKHQWPVVIERKNVIYSLAPDSSNNKYYLEP